MVPVVVAEHLEVMAQAEVVVQVEHPELAKQVVVAEVAEVAE